VLVEKVEFQGSYFTITTGDYDSLLKLVVENLALAKNQAANENEVHMLECYIESFTKGSLDAHKVNNRAIL
jgi:dipeptidyl-peptidase-3